MARRMVPAEGRLVSFGDAFAVLVSTEAETAEIWTQTVALADVAAPEPWVKQHDVPARQTDATYVVTTIGAGTLTRIRLFGSLSGSPNGDGLLVDELLVPHLDEAGRTDHLSHCTEGWPQVEMSAGGTWVRGLLGSSAVETVGQVFLGLVPPVWSDDDPFPVFHDGGFLFGAVSARPGLAHDVLATDRREAGWPTGPGLDPDSSVWFVALVWDSSGGWDFAWQSDAAMPTSPAPFLPEPQELRTRARRVDLHVHELACLDDSDDLSDGEATITIGFRAAGSPDDVRTVVWDPMESGTSKAVDERFSVVGPSVPVLRVLVLEDDSDTPFGDDDDSAIANPLVLTYPRGPWAESYQRDVTLDAGPGGDGLRLQVHVRASVSYP